MIFGDRLPDIGLIVREVFFCIPPDVSLVSRLRFHQLAVRYGVAPGEARACLRAQFRRARAQGLRTPCEQQQLDGDHADPERQV
jgi:hypothetical protein